MYEPDSPIIKYKAGLLNTAEEFGNVSRDVRSWCVT